MRLPQVLSDARFPALAHHLTELDTKVLDFAITQMSRGSRITHTRLQKSNASARALLTAMAYGFELHRRVGDIGDTGTPTATALLQRHQAATGSDR